MWNYSNPIINCQRGEDLSEDGDAIVAMWDADQLHKTSSWAQVDLKLTHMSLTRDHDEVLCKLDYLQVIQARPNERIVLMSPV